MKVRQKAKTVAKESREGVHFEEKKDQNLKEIPIGCQHGVCRA